MLVPLGRGSYFHFLVVTHRSGFDSWSDRSGPDVLSVFSALDRSALPARQHLRPGANDPTRTRKITNELFSFSSVRLFDGSARSVRTSAPRPPLLQRLHQLRMDGGRERGREGEAVRARAAADNRATLTETKDRVCVRGCLTPQLKLDPSTESGRWLALHSNPGKQRFLTMFHDL